MFRTATESTKGKLKMELQTIQKYTLFTIDFLQLTSKKAVGDGLKE